MKITNTENHYGIISIFLHWLMAVLVIALLALGLYMTEISISALKLKLFGWHKEFGILVFMLAIARLVWRVANITPQLPSSIPPWQKFAARGMHWAFYGFMLLLPLSGWFLTSAAGLPVSFFGLFVLPDFISAHENLRLLFTEIHEWLGYGLIAAICAHVAAALKHHFINKDDTLRRML